jgi:hypothetical protein
VSAICPADNCPSETCSVDTGGGNFQVVRLRLDCWDNIDAQTPGTPAWQAAWDGCIASCFLGI